LLFPGASANFVSLIKEIAERDVLSRPN